MRISPKVKGVKCEIFNIIFSYEDKDFTWTLDFNLLYFILRLLGKPAACGVDFLFYIHSYLLNRKQCVRIDNSEFLNIISSDQQKSIVGPIRFNCFFNDFFKLLKLQMPTIL